MYIERDAKIILIYASVVGIVWFVAMYFVMLLSQQATPNPDFTTIQLMIFSIIFILLAILIGSSISLKREITRQQDYLKTKPASAKPDEYVSVPYNKAGLYSLLIASVFGILAFLYLYGIFVLEQQEGVTADIAGLSIIIAVFLIIFIVILLATLFVLMNRIRTPLYYQFKPCPQCGSSDIHKVEYSWWGGLIGPALVHQVRCKQRS